MNSPEHIAEEIWEILEQHAKFDSSIGAHIPNTTLGHCRHAAAIVAKHEKK